MKKIAVIQDLSGLGKCSLTAAIPVISVMGVQACPLPTAVLSNQTGYASCFCDDYTDRMEAIMAEWEKRGLRPDGIYTGYLAGETQAGIISEFLDRFAREDTKILIDPVLGDRGGVYRVYTEGLCKAMRSLVRRADVITPNLTEALLLLLGEAGMRRQFREISFCEGKALRSRVEALAYDLRREFGLSVLTITGVDEISGDGTPAISNLVLEGEELSWISSAKYGGSYSGTGDLFASVLSAGLVLGMGLRSCVEKAASFLAKAIRDAAQEGVDRNDGVFFEQYLHELWEG